MADRSEAIPFVVRATDPASNQQIGFECVGFAMAHAKTAQLRMSGYKDVVMSMVNANDGVRRRGAQPDDRISPWDALV